MKIGQIFRAPIYKVPFARTFFIFLVDMASALCTYGVMEKELTPFEIRSALGWSQQKFADNLGIDRSSVSHIENGRDPSRSVVLLLAGLEKRARRKLDKLESA